MATNQSGLPFPAGIEWHFSAAASFDLYELDALFSSGDKKVIADDEAYYLSSVEIDNRPEGEEFYRAAEQVLGIVNGIGQANNGSYRPATLTGRFHECDGK